MGSKKTSPKPTNITLSVEFDDDSQVASAHISKSGDFLFFDRQGNEITPKCMTRANSYARPKGPKVRTHQDLNHGRGVISGLAQLAEYAMLFAIDTNTVMMDERSISAAGFLPFSLIEADGEYEVKLHEQSVQIYDFESTPEKPELCAILKLSLDVKKHAGFDEKSGIGIVTDTELGLIDDFNSRKKPIYAGQYLPAGFTLLYASADTGAEVTNKFIKVCDMAAKETLKERKDSDKTDGPFFPIDLMPGINVRVGRRNASIALVSSRLKSDGLQQGQKVTLFGTKKKK